MKPSAFLALVQSTTAAAGRAEAKGNTPGVAITGGARSYSAVTVSPRTLPFLTFHPGAEYHALPYSTLQFITGDDRGFTCIRMVFQRMAIAVHGMQLGPVFDAIRTLTAEHLFQFDGGRHDPPAPGAPVITELEFLIEKKRHTAADRAT